MKKLIPAVVMLLISAMLLGTSTYAWFSMNTAVTATGMQVQAKAESGIVISNEAYDKWTASSDTINPKYQLLPTSTADFVTWYHASSDNANDAAASQETANYTTVTNDTATYAALTNGATISEKIIYKKEGTTYTPVVLSTTTVPAEGDYYKLVLGTSNYYSANKFFIKSATAGTLSKTLYIKSVTVSGASSSQSLNKSLRVGVKLSTSTTTLIYAPISGSTLTYKVNGATNVTAIDASSSDTVGLYTNTGVTSIPATDAGLYAMVYVWFEGEDAACTSNNVVASLDNITVSVQFTTDEPATPSVSVAYDGPNSKLTATVANGTATAYVWKSCETEDGNYTVVSGATAATYTVTTGGFDKFYKCFATVGGTTYESDPVKAESIIN